MLAEDIVEWDLLRRLDTSTFKKVYVFGNRAVILKCDGTIHGIGRNTNQLIGGNTDRYYYEALSEISKGAYKDISTNGKHALAINEEGFLYSWGCNDHGQLGRDGTQIYFGSVSNMFAVRIREAACGEGFSWVLTEDGRIFEWGMYGFNELILSPCHDVDKQDQTEEKEEISSIQGSKHYPMILTKSGKLFLPSSNRPINKCNDSLHIEKVYPFEGPMKNRRIKQVVSGKNYVFALSDDGKIFYWALIPSNACSCYGKAEPKCIGEKIGRVVKIWAATSVNVLVAANTFGSLYSITWNGPGILMSISQLKDPSPGKYFAKLSIMVQGPIYDQRTAFMNLKENTNFIDDWKEKFGEAFNNKEGSDISFIVGEGIIYGHRAILSIQSSYLKALLDNDWKENSENKQVTIEEYSYHTYLRFIRFLYTGELEMSTHESDIELLKLAHEYMEKSLLILCKKLVVQGLTAENAFSTYNVANLLGLEDVRQACKILIHRNLEDVVLSENISCEEEALLLRCMKDLVCSGNIVGKDETHEVE